MIVDLARTCFTQLMQFDEEGLYIVPVRFYFAVPGAKVFPGAHMYATDYFLSHVDCDVGPGLYWNDVRVYDKGTPPPGMTGQGPPCGPLDWWENGVPSDAPPIGLDSQGRPLCCMPNNLVTDSGEVKISGAWQRCQQWRTSAGTAGRSLVRLSTSATWTPVVNTSSEFDCTDPVTPSHKIRSGAGSTCLANLATTVELVIGSTGTFLVLQSYNRITHVGIWRVPVGTAFYSGEYFALTIPI